MPPVGTFTIADEQDIVNLIAFLVTAGVVGLLTSRRRRTLLESEALTRQLRDANTQLLAYRIRTASVARAPLGSGDRPPDLAA